MVKLPPEIVNCVGFIGSRSREGTFILRGTVFFLTRRIPGIAEDISVCYAITAKHVIEGIRSSGQQGGLRLMARNGSAVWSEFDLNEWINHPDPSVDASALLMPQVHGSTSIGSGTG